MDRVDLAMAALDALQSSTIETNENTDHDEARRLRGKLLGVMIRKRRQDSETSLVDCADFLGVERQLAEAWEYGDVAPSLPQLELLSRFLNGRDAGELNSALIEDRAARQEYTLLRQRLIGALLRAARLARGQSVEALSECAQLPAGSIESLEYGEEALSVCDLTALAGALKTDLTSFSLSPEDRPARHHAPERRESPPENDADWRQFAADSENRAFIRLAMAFQHIERADLHRIADALVAISKARGEANGWSGSNS